MTDNRTENKHPRIMIAAASSGSGKTVITCGLLQVLKDKGLDPVSFKCGPDYIDPMFHRTVLGIDSNNLDTFLAGTDGVRDMVSETTRPAVIEGVMGIYDGLSPDSTAGSCYEIAQITDTPIILVVNASGTGRTVISLVKGILADDTSCLIRGIIFNRMSDAFYDKIAPQVTSEISKIRDDVALIGHIPKTESADISSRHLGLTLPGEIDDLRERIASFAQIIVKSCDVNSLLSIMCTASEAKIFPRKRARALVPTQRHVSRQNTPTKCRRLHEVFSETLCSSKQGERSCKIAIARDEAFCFYYPENIRFLEELGATIEYFSPIHDSKIPDNASAILLGGGYPELYLKELAGNESMLDSIRSAIERGIFSVAECGGFMYLHEVIASPEGDEYKMVGAVNGKCTYTGHLVNFGYTMIQSVKESAACDFREALAGMRGHEFHYYESTADGNDAILCKPSSGRTCDGMHISNSHVWGWPHLYYL